MRNERLAAYPRKQAGWNALCWRNQRPNEPIRRVFEHREGAVKGFTKRYDVKLLGYYEQHDTVPLAIQREKNIKHWSREWKIDLIVSLNPEWRDLYPEICR